MSTDFSTSARNSKQKTFSCLNKTLFALISSFAKKNAKNNYNSTEKIITLSRANGDKPICSQENASILERNFSTQKKNSRTFVRSENIKAYFKNINLFSVEKSKQKNENLVRNVLTSSIFRREKMCK